MADWQSIKAEYITTNTSYRKLAQKYGVNYRTICVRSQQEGWIEQRERHTNETTTKTLNAISDKQAERAANLISVADKLLAKVNSLLETDAAVLNDTQSMKHISGVLKDIKEIQMIRSDADMREQDARIAKLRREAEREEDNNTEVTITFGSGDAERWAK